MLTVSATASPHGTNTFGGPQVIEIIVDDPDTDETGATRTEGTSEVEVDGETLAMEQAATGKWYTYIVVKSAFEYGDDTSGGSTIVVSPTVEKYLTRTGDTTLFASPASGSNFLEDVSTLVEAADNNIHIVDVDGSFDIKYKSETITVEYDEDLTPGISTDRQSVPQNGQVHITLTDFRLNLDPTEADVWTFNITGEEKYRPPTTLTTATPFIWDLGPNDGGFEIDYSRAVSAIIDPTTKKFLDDVKAATGASVTDLQSNIAGLEPTSNIPTAIVKAKAAVAAIAVTDTTTRADLEAAAERALVANDIMVFTESGANTGVFESWNSDDVTNFKVSGTTSHVYVLDYDGEEEQVFVDDSDPVLALDSSAWNSGDELTVTVTDENLNLNTMGDDDMTITSADLPILMLGDPVTLGSAGVTANSVNHTATGVAHMWSVDSSTHVGTLELTSPLNQDYATITITPTAAQKAALLAGSSFAQYVGPAANATFTGSTGTMNVTLAAATASNPEMEDVPNVGTINSIMLSYEDTDEDTNTTTLTAAFEDPQTIVFDIFTVNAASSAPHSAIYRFLAEETAEGSGVFEATITSTMVNQLDNNLALAKDASYIGDSLDAVLHRAYTGSSSGPTVEYIDEDARTNALTHDGTVSLDSEKYNVDSGVTVTLTDPDLQRDTDRIDTYSTNAQMSTLATTLLNVKIGDCSTVTDTDDLFLRETAADSGAFEASFDVPATCGAIQTTGNDLVVTYYDFRDGNSRPNESSDTATIGADTGSVELVDTTVYPVPGEAASEVVMVYVAVEDADYNTSSTSIDRITDTTVKITIEGMDIVTLGNSANPLVESATNSGVFEGQIGLTSNADQVSSTAMIFHKEIRQGDIITVSYTDNTDASGSENVATDSATFDLRTATLQTDKSEYVIGQDALITLIEPDLNYDSDSIDTIPLTRILWDSDAYDDNEGISHSAFGAVPSNLRETGTNTGIFQVSITIPEQINNRDLERGESITLTYNDQGPSGAKFVGDDDTDVEVFIATSNFGATLDLDQRVYTWTDKVFVTIVASDYNFDSNTIDEVGNQDNGKINISTREGTIKNYRLVETGPDTGVFSGTITLSGFDYDSVNHNAQKTSGTGPTNGYIETNNEDGLSVSFDYSPGEPPLVASAEIRWNVGEVQWLEPSYASTDSGTVRVIDPDMNLNPDAVDNIEMVVYSDTFRGGIKLTVTETNDSTGIFEGAVAFDPNRAPQGHRLHVTEGDIVTAIYEDFTLPRPDGKGDSQDITATTLIGDIVPPLERAPVSNPRIVDAFDNEITTVSAGQQIQIAADITSGQDKDQNLVYIVQIQDGDGVTVNLSWFSGSLGAGKTISPSQSWTPDESGSYTASIFVWESLDNPTALSPQVSLQIDVV